MEAIKIKEKKQKLIWDYDAEADVLYISFGNPVIAEGIDIGEGTIIRIDPESHEINGLTILNPVNRTFNIMLQNEKKQVAGIIGEKDEKAME